MSSLSKDRLFFEIKYLGPNPIIDLKSLKRLWLELPKLPVLTGNVGNNEPGNGLFNGHKLACGLGPRFFIYKDKRTLLRLDIGFNNEGNSGMYFGVNEAF